MRSELLAKWRQICEGSVGELMGSSGHEQAYMAAHYAQVLTAIANHISGVACPGCDGHGTKAYSSTAGWQGGVGGQGITDGVCDECWGTGRTDRTGPDLRKILAEQQRHRRYADGIAKALEGVREHRSTGEPSLSDREEIVRLVQRALRMVEV